MDHTRVAKLLAILGSPNENEAAVALQKLRRELGSSGFSELATSIKNGGRKTREDALREFAEAFADYKITYPHDVWYRSWNGSKKGMSHQDPKYGYEPTIAGQSWSDIIRLRVCLRRYTRVSPDRKLEQYQETIPISRGRWLADHIQHFEQEAERYAALSPGRKKRWPEYTCDCPDCLVYRPKNKPKTATRRDLSMIEEEPDAA
jgi:hypothetical protein